MTNVVDLKKFAEYKSILSMCDMTEKVVRRDKKLSQEQKREKLRRVSRTRAKCAEQLNMLTTGDEA